MPQRGRSRRAAARQSQLGQRKRRQVRGPSGVPPPGFTPGAEEAAEGDGLASRQPSETSSPQSAAVRQPAQGRARSRPTVYSYVVPEVKRILALSAVVVVVLVALSFVLR